MFRFGLLALGAAAVSGFQMPHVAPPPRTAARAGASPTMAGPFDLKGKVAFVAGVADSSGYGWAICKALAEAGATVTVGTWPPVLGIFEKSLRSGEKSLRHTGIE